MNDQLLTQAEITQLAAALGQPAAKAITHSRQQLQAWFARTAPLIEWDVIETPIGPLTLAISDKGLCRIHFGDDVAHFLNTQIESTARTAHNPAALAQYAIQLAEYFAGQRTEFEIALDERYLTDFQKGVFKIVRRIPAGVVLTYGEVAKAIDRPKASRAVGRALGANPIPLVIPCHRVIGQNGSLTGYGGGIEKKRHLLMLERAI
jgi:O-6-methylguanine DNA methyltransferase